MNKFRPIKNKNYEHFKKPKPGEIIMVPQHPSLMEEKSRPYSNTIANPPEWFRRIAKFPGSIRGCAGMQDFLSMGVTIPMWTNVIFTPFPDSPKRWTVDLDQMARGDQEGNCDVYKVHSFDFPQTGTCPMSDIRKVEDSCYPKLLNPWSIVTAKGWSTLALPILLEPNPDYDVVPAIVHTDFYHTLNLVLNIKTDKEFAIKYGTPIYQLIPFERKYVTPTLKFEDHTWTPLLTSRGFNSGPLMPPLGSSTATPYRQNRRIVDKEIEQESLNKKWWQRLWNR